MSALARTLCIAAMITGAAGAADAARHYYAECRHGSHGVLGYSGPGHRDAAGAQQDCAAHLKTYPRHRCAIRFDDY